MLDFLNFSCLILTFNLILTFFLEFSSLLMQNLEKYQNGKFILWHDINFCFEITCDKIIKHTSAIFYEALSMNHTLPLILHELQVYFIFQ